jgi:hypothetical protein
VSRHSENFLRAVEHKDWARAGEFIDENYRDQWGNQRAVVLERIREVFAYLRDVRLTPSQTIIRLDHGQGHWQSRITIDGRGGDVITLVKERVNSVATPFDLEWRQKSAKPWDWKLVRVSNTGLNIPEYTE